MRCQVNDVYMLLITINVTTRLTGRLDKTFDSLVHVHCFARHARRKKSVKYLTATSILPSSESKVSILLKNISELNWK